MIRKLKFFYVFDGELLADHVESTAHLRFLLGNSRARFADSGLRNVRRTNNDDTFVTVFYHNATKWRRTKMWQGQRLAFRCLRRKVPCPD